MKVLHTISGLDKKSGGPSLSVYTLAKGCRDIGLDIDILTYADENAKKLMIAQDKFIYTIPTPWYSRFAYSPQVNIFLDNHPYDIYYSNGLWQYPSYAAARFANKHHKPNVIMPHGMLYPEALKKSKWIKRISLALYQRALLDKATVIHATCMQEMEHIRSLGIKTPIAVIPNALEISKHKVVSTKNKSAIKRIGFIGRFAPIKNIELLIEAWSKAGKNRQDWELVLIGDGPAGYQHSLVKLASDLGIENILFPGFLSGTTKEEMLNSLAYLILPSKSENFGMVVPEALILGIPVIASKGTPWEELQTCKAGWWIEIGVLSLTETLNEAMRLSETEYSIMGQNGRQLVEDKYAIEAVAKKMIRFYGWILEGGIKPEFVF